jgi:hypothetical protein
MDENDLQDIADRADDNLTDFDMLARMHDLDSDSWVAVIWDEENNKLDGIYGPFSNAGDAIAYIESFRAWLMKHDIESSGWVGGNAVPLREPTPWD